MLQVGATETDEGEEEEPRYKAGVADALQCLDSHLYLFLNLYSE
jgi:hypothetical protein